MADEDFEIDVYGDEGAEADPRPDEANVQSFENNSSITIANGSNPPEQEHAGHQGGHDAHETAGADGQDQATPTQPLQQGVKRKGQSDERTVDERPVDPGALKDLLISDMNWWVTDDEIRGWVRQAACEDELKDITFSEHKVNGKSKGQAFLQFTSPQAATAVKHQVDRAGPEANQPGSKKLHVIYSNPHNPFRTLPKDAPARANKDVGSRGGASAGGFNDRGGGNFRGRGNFMGPRGGGFRGNFGGGGGNMGGGFNNNMGGANFGFNNMGGGGGNFGFRGGMMGGGMGGGMRGGGVRGGRGGGMNPGMNPAAMGGGMMGGMGGMGMPMMGFQQPHFNPAFFAGGGGGGGQQSDWQNPHGAKRPRGE
ncbi:hypothetical protein GGR56DRAFT_665724 [Xylariaceae sp. FL0804]|nr:hypothetical protein GGR56DRAFT_665724 [Xylariaceae sp. FL0804]